MEVEFPMLDLSLFHKKSYEADCGSYNTPSYGVYKPTSDSFGPRDAFSHTTLDDLLSSALDSCSSDNASSVNSVFGQCDIPHRNTQAQQYDTSPAVSLSDELEFLAYHSQPDTPSEPVTPCVEASALPTDTRRTYVENTYDTSSVMYDNDDLAMLTGLVNCDEVLKTHKRPSVEHSPLPVTVPMAYEQPSPVSEPSPMREAPSPQVCVEQPFASPAAPQDKSTTSKETSEDNRKGKISSLQRTALDKIFFVTDRPSRGLVMHIGSELVLSPVTVKNFFSNGRRRLRRAAARLNDPERTRRENQRRKEKRRLAALAAASAASKDKGVPTTSKNSCLESSCSPVPRDPPVLSPQRRALMEKLMVKVQRSAAQKSLSSPAPEVKEGYVHNHPECQTHSKAVDAMPSLTLQSDSLYVDKEAQLDTATAQLNQLLQNGSSYSADDFLSVEANNPLDHVQSSSLYQQVEQGPFSPTSWQTLLQA